MSVVWALLMVLKMSFGVGPVDDEQCGNCRVAVSVGGVGPRVFGVDVGFVDGFGGVGDVVLVGAMLVVWALLIMLKVSLMTVWGCWACR